MAIPGISRASLLALACAGFATTASGNEDKHHHHQQAHVHGEAKLQVAIEGRTAELILQSPAANLLGFEHTPQNAGQEAALTETRKWLTANSLVQNANNDCNVTAASTYQEQDLEDGNGDGHGQEKEGSHSDFEVTQRIECGSELTRPLTTPLMTRFPGIEHLSVDWLGSGSQGHTELHAGEDEIHLDH